MVRLNPITMPSATPNTTASSSPATVRHRVCHPYSKNSPRNFQKAGQRSLGDAIL